MSVVVRLRDKLEDLGFSPPVVIDDWRQLARIVGVPPARIWDDEEIAETALAWIEREELRLRIQGLRSAGWMRQEPDIAEPMGGEFLDHPDLNCRLRWIFHHFNSLTLSELRDLKDAEILRIPNVGHESIKRFRRFLDRVSGGIAGNGRGASGYRGKYIRQKPRRLIEYLPQFAAITGSPDFPLGFVALVLSVYQPAYVNGCIGGMPAVVVEGLYMSLGFSSCLAWFLL